MTYSETADLLDNPREIRCLVTRPMGGWKWGKAYAIARYRLVASYDGAKPVWQFISRTMKMSLPQIKRVGFEYDQVGRPS